MNRKDHLTLEARLVGEIRDKFRDCTRIIEYRDLLIKSKGVPKDIREVLTKICELHAYIDARWMGALEAVKEMEAEPPTLLSETNVIKDIYRRLCNLEMKEVCVKNPKGETDDN